MKKKATEFGRGQKKGRARLTDRLWSWSRMTAWRKMAALIKAAGIPEGPQASPKGLRRGFGVAAVRRALHSK
jgi:integrase/recombinase XerD